MVRANPQGEATLLPPISSLSPLLCSPIVLDLSTHPTTQSPPPPAQSFLVHLESISTFPGTAYARSLPGPSTAAVVAAAETGSWLGCGGERRRMSQPRRPEGNRGERRGRIQGSGGSDKRAAEPPAARIPLGILTGKFTDFSVHLRLVLGMFIQAFLQALTPVGEQWSEHY